jgi:hypothetical protein
MALFSSLMIEDETPILNDYKGQNIIMHFLDKREKVALNTIFKKSELALKNSPPEVFETLSLWIPRIIKSRIPGVPAFLDSTITVPEPVRGEGSFRQFGNANEWYKFSFSEDFSLHKSVIDELTEPTGNDPISFQVSKLKFHKVYSSEYNLDLLNSITDFNNTAIFRSILIQRFIDFGWVRAYPTLFLEFLFNLGFLAIFSYSLGTNNPSLAVFAVVLGLNAVLFIRNFLLFIADWRYYLGSLWNLIDLAKCALTFAGIILLIIHPGLDNKEDSDARMTVNSFAIFFTYIKMIRYFRIFTPTSNLAFFI